MLENCCEEYALNWIKCVSETIYSLLPRHIPMSFSGRKKRKLERILIPQSCILKRSCLVIHTLRLIHKIHLLFILFRVWCSQTQCKIWFGYSILTTKSYVWCVILTFDVESWSALLSSPVLDPVLFRNLMDFESITRLKNRQITRHDFLKLYLCVEMAFFYFSGYCKDGSHCTHVPSQFIWYGLHSISLVELKFWVWHWQGFEKYKGK